MLHLLYALLATAGTPKTNLTCRAVANARGVRVPSAGPTSRSSRLVSRDGQRFEERQLHPVFTSRGTSEGSDENYGQNVGYFTYEYDPQATPSRLEVRALDFSKRLMFKGARVPPEVLSGCVASVWRKGGPVHGIVFLASLVLALRFRRRH